MDANAREHGTSVSQHCFTCSRFFWSSITAFFCPGFVDLVMSMRPEAIMRMLAGMRARTAAEYIITIVTYAPRSFHGVLFQV